MEQEIYEAIYEALLKTLEQKEIEIETGFDAAQFEKLIERVREDYVRPINFDQYGRIFF